MLRLNRASVAIIPCKSGSIRNCSWGGFQWSYFEPLQVKCCMVYQNSKDRFSGKDFNIPLNIESKYVASTFDFKEFFDRKDNENKFFLNQEQAWTNSFLSANRFLRVFKILVGDCEHDPFIKDKSKQINRELDVFESAKKCGNLDFFLRVSQVVKSCEKLESIKKDILEKYSEVLKKK